VNNSADSLASTASVLRSFSGVIPTMIVWFLASAGPALAQNHLPDVDGSKALRSNAPQPKPAQIKHGSWVLKLNAIQENQNCN
jgi:hypothetical protein